MAPLRDIVRSRRLQSLIARFVLGGLQLGVVEGGNQSYGNDGGDSRQHAGTRSGSLR